MRKAAADCRRTGRHLTLNLLQVLLSRGFRFVQVRGLTIDRHYDYTEPDWLMLFPMKSLPSRREMKDIYEPINSELLRDWALHPNEGIDVIVADI